MYRTAARVRSSRLRVTDWIPKMLFLWSREPSSLQASPRAGPWFAWFATAVLLWRCRRRIARAVFGSASPLRYLRRKRFGSGGGVGGSSVGGCGTPSLVVSKAHHHRSHKHRSRPQPRSAPPSSGDHHRAHIKYQPTAMQPQQKKPQALRHREVRTRDTRLKRLQHAGDGPHVATGGTTTTHHAATARKIAVSASCVQISQQLYYRVTRSGRIYGKYPSRPAHGK